MNIFLLSQRITFFNCFQKVNLEKIYLYMLWHLVLLDRDSAVNGVNGLAVGGLSWGPTALGICLVCNKTA